MADHTYDDDRPGMMRLHIAQERAALAAKRYTYRVLAQHARENHLPSGSRKKGDLTLQMALDGLIDTEGNMRRGHDYLYAGKEDDG